MDIAARREISHRLRQSQAGGLALLHFEQVVKFGGDGIGIGIGVSAAAEPGEGATGRFDAAMAGEPDGRLGNGGEAGGEKEGEEGGNGGHPAPVEEGAQHVDQEDAQADPACKSIIENKNAL